MYGFSAVEANRLPFRVGFRPTPGSRLAQVRSGQSWVMERSIDAGEPAESGYFQYLWVLMDFSIRSASASP